MNSSNNTSATLSFESLAFGLSTCAANGAPAETVQKTSKTPVDFLLRVAHERRFVRALQALRRL